MSVFDEALNSVPWLNSQFERVWEQTTMPREQSLFFIDIALQYAPNWFIEFIEKKQLSLCDFGCALGDGVQELSQRFPNNTITGIDIAKSAINRAKVLHKKLNVHFKCMDIAEDEEHYDVLFSSNTLEHFHNPFTILNQLTQRTLKFIWLLLPLGEDSFPEHFYSFDYHNIPHTLPNDFQLIFMTEINTKLMQPSYWPTQQIMLIYAKKTEIKTLKQQQIRLCNYSSNHFPNETEINKTLTDKNLVALLGKQWFYEFELPNGSKTKCPPTVRSLHKFRRQVLLNVIRMHFGEHVRQLNALDLGSHQGYFTLELAKAFNTVQAVEKNAESLASSQLIFNTFKLNNIELIHGDFMLLKPDSIKKADFVLLYGVIYHTDDPIAMLRKAASVTARILLIETQILNFDLEAEIDWGHFESQKKVQGLFGLINDDATSSEGGMTELALVPSLQGLYSVMKSLGFTVVSKIEDSNKECEQFYRNKRAILLCIR